MSQESFVKYYSEFLADPSNQALKDELESAPNRETFAQIALKQGQDNGFDFSLEEMNLVMWASERKQGGEGELSEQELEAVAGGTSAFLGNLSGINLGSIATVKLGNVPRFDASAASTVMCCW